MERHHGVEQPVDGQPASRSRCRDRPRGTGRPAPPRPRCTWESGPQSRYQPPGSTSCSVIDPARSCIDRGSPSIAMIRSTSISGSSGSRTRVGWASIAANSGPSTAADRADGELQACAPDRARARLASRPVPLGGACRGSRIHHQQPSISAIWKASWFDSVSRDVARDRRYASCASAFAVSVATTCRVKRSSDASKEARDGNHASSSPRERLGGSSTLARERAGV